MFGLKTRSAPLVTAGATALLLLTAACTGGSSGGDSGAVTDTVTLALGGPVASLDPAKGGSFEDYQVAAALYDTLVAFNEDGEVVPQLATSWETTPNSATFTLRDGVTCSDGTALSPEIVAASLQRYMTPETAAPLLTQVIGPQNTATVTADDAASTVTVQLDKPWSQLLIGLTSAYTGIICPSGVEDAETLLTGSSGTGPFVAVSQVSGSSYTFERRTDYEWGPELPGLPEGTPPKTLVMRVVPDENSSANLLSTGELQIAAFSSQNYSRFKDESGYVSVTQPQQDAILVFNETPGRPTARPEVRQAIAQALDRNALNEIMSDGRGDLATNLGQSTYACYDDSLGDLLPEHDPAAAKKVLDGVPLKVIGTTVVAGGTGTTAITAQLNAAGADATLSNMVNQAWVAELFSGKNDWDVTMLGYGNTINSILSAGSLFTGAAPPNGSNIGAVNNPEAPELYATAGATTGEEGCAATSAFQRSLLESYDALPISTVPATVVFSKDTSALLNKGFVLAGTIRIAD
ncbi:MAG: Extracellular peptide-binding protein [Blastococcus sp.]|nr:Extracellular peptide-binding protein [Blastococcus sp.]